MGIAQPDDGGQRGDADDGAQGHYLAIVDEKRIALDAEYIVCASGRGDDIVGRRCLYGLVAGSECPAELQGIGKSLAAGFYDEALGIRERKYGESYFTSFPKVIGNGKVLLVLFHPTFVQPAAFSAVDDSEPETAGTFRKVEGKCLGAGNPDAQQHQDSGQMDRDTVHVETL